VLRVWTRLDRALVREVRGPLTLGLAGFSFVLLLNYLFVLTRQTIEKRMPFSLVFTFVVSEFPRIIVYTAPMAALLATLVGVGRMATQSELVALRSAGVPPRRIFRPVLAAMVLLAALSFVCAQWLMPAGVRRERALVRSVLKLQDVNREIDPGIFYDRLPQAVIYARSAGESAQGRVFGGVLIYRESIDGKTNDLLVAKRARAALDPATGQRSLLLDDGEWHIYRPNQPGAYNVVRFRQYTLPFPPDPALAAFAPSPSTDMADADPHELGLLDLVAHRSALQAKLAAAAEPGLRAATEAQLRKSGLEWHRRISLPVAVLGLAFLGFPLAARSKRGGRFAGLSQSLIIIFVFWLALSTGWGLSEQGKWPIWLGPWVPVLLAAIWGLYLWSRMPQVESGGRGLRERLADLRAWLAARRRAAPSAPSGGAAPKLDAGDAEAPPPRRFVLGRLEVFLGGGYLRMFGAVLFVLVVLAMAVAFKSAIDEVPPGTKAFPWGALLEYLALELPSQLRFMVPIAALFGAAVCLSSLTRSGEIIALKSAGIGPVRIAVPLLTVTLAVCGVYAVLQEQFLPQAERRAERTLDRVRGKVAGPELMQTGRRWLVGEGERVWNYVDWDSKRQFVLAPGVISVDFENAHIRERLQAADVRYERGSWIASRGWRRSFPVDPATGAPTPTLEQIARAPLAFDETPELFGVTKRRLALGDDMADQMSFAELWASMHRLERTGYPTAPMVVGLNEKLVFPLLPVVLVLVGVPLTVSGWRRTGSLYGFGVAILLVVVFWLTHAVFTALGREAVLNPVVATWIPTLALSGAGAYLLAKAR